MSKARRGAIGVVPIAGTGGLLIAWGELIVDRLDHAQHAFVLLDDSDQPGARVLEAEPNGARVAPLAHASKDVLWLDPPFKDSTRDRIVAVAAGFRGLKYSWWTYLWIALCRFGWKPKWLAKKVGSRKDAMCSQLADLTWIVTKEQLPADDTDCKLLTVFDDDRLPQNVTPGDLAHAAEISPYGHR